MPDGTEVFFCLSGKLCTFYAPLVVGPPSEFVLNNGQAFVVADTLVSVRAPINYGFNVNTGFEKRVLKTLNNNDSVTANKTLNLLLPIRKVFKIFESNDHVFRGIKHQIKLYKNTNNKILFSHDTATPDATMIISDISWWVPALRPSLKVGFGFR